MCKRRLLLYYIRNQQGKQVACARRQHIRLSSETSALKVRRKTLSDNKRPIKWNINHQTKENQVRHNNNGKERLLIFKFLLRRQRKYVNVASVSKCAIVHPNARQKLVWPRTKIDVCALIWMHAISCGRSKPWKNMYISPSCCRFFPSQHASWFSRRARLLTGKVFCVVAAWATDGRAAMQIMIQQQQSPWLIASQFRLCSLRRLVAIWVLLLLMSKYFWWLCLCIMWSLEIENLWTSREFQ